MSKIAFGIRGNTGKNVHVSEYDLEIQQSHVTDQPVAPCVRDIRTPEKQRHKHKNIKKVQRGAYLSALVLLHLLNELGKRDKMRGLPLILSLFRNEFNKFNKTRARMLDSIYHITLKLIKYRI